MFPESRHFLKGFPFSGKFSFRLLGYCNAGKTEGCFKGVLWGILWVSLSGIFSQRLFSQEISPPLTPTANRWAILLDLSPISKNDAATLLSLQDFQAHLEQIGIPKNQILLYSCRQEKERWPSRENIQRLLEGFRNPDRNRMPCGQTGRRLRHVSGCVELQVYILARGFTDPQQKKTFLVPFPVSETEILSGQTETLISLEEVEEALGFPISPQAPIERTLLLVDFQSMVSVTRGVKGASPFQETDLRQLAARGYRDEPDAEGEIATGNVPRYLHLRIYTKNHSLKESSATAFYQTLYRGLEGYADILGNQDGMVQAEELSRYLRFNHPQGNIEVVQNGNDSFPLGKARRTIQIPDGLFLKISQTLTRFPEEQRSAREREARLQVRKRREP